MSVENPRTAIVGLGMTEMGKVYGRSATDFAVEAITAAVADAGLSLSDVDGLYVNPGVKNCDPTRLQTFGAGGVQVMLMDGSVRNVGANTSAVTWTRALVPNDGFVLGNDW